ncbi:sterol desaturase [Seminavis robusta]|uniref:Sterol desaturase n=1 Tax=Seminavis robusta TaxID=568900 RepID=A0A9N8DZ50_9STRA|nr:sterol desaturase [Seminavis robusta]|eukprot:Sro466_g148840.1 sterol desaturase (524) ;mRNA; r:41490-43248
MTESNTLTQRHAAKSTNKEPASESNPDETKKKTATSNEEPPKFDLMKKLGSIGGMVDFSFFRAPAWVDLSLPPGTTSQWELNQGTPDFVSIFTGQAILFSPNLVWIIIAALVYVLAPYDLDTFREHGWTLDWYLQRASLNVFLVMGYYGFWHVVLYWMGMSKRPFATGRVYKWTQVCHNVWYCFLGALQWTGWEMIMLDLYATGRIGYQSDDEILTTGIKGVANFFFCAVFVPFFRETHFFFAHRIIHIRCLYKYIHSLHHRNTDIEPFSGLCMSPSEHLYYYSSIAPSVYWYASPFQFLWNGIHLILSPGAGHSGWEDHWHSDQFHAGHHRYFECNYGTPGTPFDRWFGCFRETMAPQTKKYDGDATECKSQEGSPILTARADAKSTLLGLPSWDQMLYMTVSSLGLPAFVMYVAIHRSDDENNKPFWMQASVAALIVSVGPMVLAAFLSLVTANPPVDSMEKFRNAMLYPFHNEAMFGKFGVGLLVGTLLGIMPMYHFFHSLFVADPNDTVYNQIWGTILS